MKLYDNWRDILRYAWSARLAAGAALFSAVQFVLPFLDGMVPRLPLFIAAVVAALGSALCALGAIYARVVPQPNTLDKP